MYTGFGRLLILQEIKIKYLYVCMGQEVFLHTLPLTLLVAYNNLMLRKSFKLDIACLVTSGLHLLIVFAELTIFRCYLNKGINLEQRIKFSSNNRAKDMTKIGFVAAVFGAISFVVGWYTFKI